MSAIKDPSYGYALWCPECGYRSGIAEMAQAHIATTGHPAPEENGRPPPEIMERVRTEALAFLRAEIATLRADLAAEVQRREAAEADHDGWKRTAALASDTNEKLTSALAAERQRAEAAEREERNAKGKLSAIDSAFNEGNVSWAGRPRDETVRALLAERARIGEERDALAAEVAGLKEHLASWTQNAIDRTKERDEWRARSLAGDKVADEDASAANAFVASSERARAAAEKERDEARHVRDDVQRSYSKANYLIGDLMAQFAEARVGVAAVNDADRIIRETLHAPPPVKGNFFTDRMHNGLNALIRERDAAERDLAAAREALRTIERRLREDAAPLAALVQRVGDAVDHRAWKAVYSSAVHAQGVLRDAALTPAAANIPGLDFCDCGHQKRDHWRNTTYASCSHCGCGDFNLRAPAASGPRVVVTTVDAADPTPAFTVTTSAPASSGADTFGRCVVCGGDPDDRHDESVPAHAAASGAGEGKAGAPDADFPECTDCGEVLIDREGTLVCITSGCRSAVVCGDDCGARLGASCQCPVPVAPPLASPAPVVTRDESQPCPMTPDETCDDDACVSGCPGVATAPPHSRGKDEEADGTCHVCGEVVGLGWVRCDRCDGKEPHSASADCGCTACGMRLCPGREPLHFAGECPVCDGPDGDPPSAREEGHFARIGAMADALPVNEDASNAISRIVSAKMDLSKSRRIAPSPPSETPASAVEWRDGDDGKVAYVNGWRLHVYAFPPGRWWANSAPPLLGPFESEEAAQRAAEAAVKGTKETT